MAEVNALGRISSLEGLLRKNANEGLSHEEKKIAEKMILNPVYNKRQACRRCDEYSIHDASLCQGHALHSLVIETPYASSLS